MPNSLGSILGALEQVAKESSELAMEFTDAESLPEEKAIPLDAPKWVRVPKVACLFLDMVGSTKIDYDNDVRTSTKIYQTFTGTLVRLWRMFGASYYDIKGDGGFALFDGPSSAVRAFLAGETFRSLINRKIRDRVINISKDKVHLGTRTSMSYGSVVVKRIGTRGRYNHNLVWLGTTVNHAAKILQLASAEEGQEEFVVTVPAFMQLKHEKIWNSCGCQGSKPAGGPTPLWTEQQTPDLKAVGVEKLWKLRSLWCETHGEKFFAKIAEDHKITVSEEAS
jgi:class 3 adenylate cyclase